MKKHFISSNPNIKVEILEVSLTPVIGQEKLLITGTELKVYHYLVSKPDELLARWMVTDNDRIITAQQWVDEFDTAVAAKIWDDEAQIQQNNAVMASIDAFADLPF